MLEINKQAMKYSRQGERVEIYERDSDGNIVYTKYTTADGKPIPVIKDTVIGYSNPVTFRASINNKLSEVLIKEFGIDDSTSYLQIVTDKGALPIKTGDYIWKSSAVGRDKNNLVDVTTADYIVKGVADEGLTVDLFLLQRNVR